jgi:formylglycine-generating enzyme required for sulfatase activity
MPLTALWCNNTKVSDLSPVKTAPLAELRCDVPVASDNMKLLRGMRTLARINDKPAGVYWLQLATMPKPAASSPQHSTTPSLQSSAAERTLTTSTGIEMVWIPPGAFLMGSTAKEREWALGPEGKLEPKYMFESGEPKRTTIKNGFWLGRTEVTNGQWQKFVDATGYVTEAEKRGNAHAPDSKTGQWATVQGASWRNPNFGFPRKENHAVCCITWNDATAFCEWLTETEKKAGKLPAGMVYRLPGEAEWEYACRGGKEGTKFWWGDAMEKGKGRLNGSGDVWGDSHKFVSPVDSFGSRGRNGFGLADMLGNVYEWCLDGFDPETAHAEPYKEKTSERVLRGGSFHRNPGTSAAPLAPGLHRPTRMPHGFRVCAGVAW